MHNSNYATWRRNSDEKDVLQDVYTQFTKGFFTLNLNFIHGLRAMNEISQIFLKHCHMSTSSEWENNMNVNTMSSIKTIGIIHHVFKLSLALKIKIHYGICCMIIIWQLSPGTYCKTPSFHNIWGLSKLLFCFSWYFKTLFRILSNTFIPTSSTLFSDFHYLCNFYSFFMVLREYIPQYTSWNTFLLVLIFSHQFFSLSMIH